MASRGPTAGARRWPAPPEGFPVAPDGYDDLSLIAQGGTAAVYRAHDVLFDRPVALKILLHDDLDDRDLRRFRAECLAIGRVSAHPHIVTVYDAGTTADLRPWLAMEYCSGGTLADLIDAGALEVDAALDMTLKVAAALHAAHCAGILHRDVKPHNVLITTYGEPALADFGIAVVRTEHGVEVGDDALTVVHSAPEVLAGGEGSAVSDVYSLASTCYTMLSGEPPFAWAAAQGMGGLMKTVMTSPAPRLARSDVPAEVHDILYAALDPDPDQRPQSARELADALGEASGGRPLPAFVESVPPQRQTGSGRVLTGAQTASHAELTHLREDLPAISRRNRREQESATHRRGRGIRWAAATGAVLVALAAAWLAWPDGSSSDDPQPTPSAAPPSIDPARAPSDLVVVASTGSLDLTWSLPDRSVRPVLSADPELEIPTDRGQTSYTVSGLDSGLRYCFTLSGTATEAGQGIEYPPGEPVCGTTL